MDSKEIIYYQSEALDEFKRFLSEGSFSSVFFLVDENTHEHCLPGLLAEIEELPPTEILEVEAGEESKSPEVLVQLWMALSDLEADRNSLLVNVGGGVICDLGGFLASTYMRGISFVNFPTSLLAMVDASSGGKTGINLNDLKNQIGVFNSAERVFIIPEFLQTLPIAHRRSAYAEMLKHGLIADKEYWTELSTQLPDNFLPSLEWIKKSVEIKSEIVDEDFREKGRRAILNFGHSLGHALESYFMDTETPLHHGEAVAMGMLGELFLSWQHAGLSKVDSEEAIKAIRNIFPDLKREIELNKVLSFLQKDKKNKRGEINFVLLPEIGKAQFPYSLSEKDIREALNFFSEI